MRHGRLLGPYFFMAVCLLIVVGNCLLKMHFELATLPREPQLTRAMGIRPR